MLSRRRFLGGLSSTAAALATAGASRSLLPTIHAAEERKLRSPASSGIEHVVLVMMENRSFDHVLGWMEEADGRQNGLTYKDKQGVPHHTFHLRDYQNCNYADPDHSYAGGRVQFDNGACDGWLRAGTNDRDLRCSRGGQRGHGVDSHWGPG